MERENSSGQIMHHLCAIETIEDRPLTATYFISPRAAAKEGSFTLKPGKADIWLKHVLPFWSQGCTP